MKPKKNLTATSDRLWEVGYSIDDELQEETLWVLAGDLKAAAKKAIQFLRPLRAGVVKIDKVESEGTIDVF